MKAYILTGSRDQGGLLGHEFVEVVFTDFSRVQQALDDGFLSVTIREVTLADDDFVELSDEEFEAHKDEPTDTFVIDVVD